MRLLRSSNLRQNSVSSYVHYLILKPKERGLNRTTGVFLVTLRVSLYLAQSLTIPPLFLINVHLETESKQPFIRFTFVQMLFWLNILKKNNK